MIADTQDDLILALTELESTKVIIVIDGFEPDYLSTLEVASLPILRGEHAVTCFTVYSWHHLFPSGGDHLGRPADQEIWSKRECG